LPKEKRFGRRPSNNVYFKEVDALGSYAADVALDSCAVIPRYSLLYLEEGYINAELKNNLCSSIIIEDIICSFQTEAGLVPYEVHSPEKRYVDSGGRITIQIPFTVELDLIPFTNVFSLNVRYRVRGTDKIIAIPIDGFCVTNSIVIYPSRQTEKYFFVSHKIPEDTSIASKLDHHLQKVGFKGFLAEDNPRPGLDIWAEKIMPAIQDESCIGVIALWGANAEKSPAAIIRELKYAQDYGKTQILLVEKQTNVPDSFPKNVREYQESIGTSITEVDLIKLVKSIDNMYKSGKL
jgi:hypothetical protein